MAKATEIEGLNCHDSAANGMRLVLDLRLAEMCRLRVGALDWSDPEGVHDMRVASRRLRSAVRDFKPYLRRHKLASAAAELKEVADALGAVRDQDVAIIALEALQQEMPAETTSGINALTDERRATRNAARTALIAAIERETIDSLQRDFTAAVEQATEARRPHRKKKKSAAVLSFRAVGREVILARLKELRQLSACLYQPFETDPLHRMRIAAKRLRYAMELFAACWGEALVKHAAEVAELQTSLGELHDCDVWLEGFGQRLRETHAREANEDGAANDADEQKRNAAIRLLRHFAKARMKHFNNALARWHEWETSDFFTQLNASLDDRPPAVELSLVTLSAADAVAADLEERELS